MNTTKEIVDLKTIAHRLGYSAKHMRNEWHRLLCGVRLLKLPGGRKICFYWEDVEKLLEGRK